MIILTIVYPVGAGSTFDFDYFERRHLPMVGKLFGPHGLNSASVLRGAKSVDGGEPAFHAMTLLNFATEHHARDAMKSPEAGMLMDDIATFTNVKPLMQFNLPFR